MINLENAKKLLAEFNYDPQFIEEFSLRSKESFELITNLLHKKQENSILQASWKFLPPGTTYPNEKHPIIFDGNPEELLENLPPDMQAKARKTIYVHQFLEQQIVDKNCLYKLVGINEFSGYEAYVLKNGKVILHKYIEGLNPPKIAVDRAIYVIPYDQLIEISSKSRNEIMQCLKNGTLKGVIRIIQGGKKERWKSKLSQAILGIDYTDDLVEEMAKYFDRQIKSGTLKSTKNYNSKKLVQN